MDINGFNKRILAGNCRGNNINSNIKQTSLGRGDIKRQGEESL